MGVSEFIPISPDRPVTRPARMTFLGRRFQDGQYMAIWVEDGIVVGDEPIQRVRSDGEGLQRWIIPGFVELHASGESTDDLLRGGVTRTGWLAEPADELARAMCPAVRESTGDLGEQCLSRFAITEAVAREGRTFIEAVAMATTRPRIHLPGWRGKWGCFKGDPADMVELEWQELTGRIRIQRVTVGGFAVSADQVV